MSFILSVDPSPVTECTQCCTELNDLNLVGLELSCIDGCTPPLLGGTEQTAGISCVVGSLDLETCEVGENMRLYGSSVVNDTSIAICVEGDLSIESVDDLETINGFSLATADCSACCASGQAFDSDYAAFWDENSCVSVCEDPSSFDDCNNQATAQRLGCAHGYDLRLGGGDSVQWSLGTQTVNCVNGQILLIDQGEDEESGVPQGVFLGIGIGVVALVLIAVVALSSRQPRRPRFADMPLHRIDDDVQAENKPNVVLIPGSAEKEHMGKLKQQMTLGENSGRKSKPGTSTSFAEKPDLGTMKMIGMGKISRRFKRAVKLVKPGRLKKKRKPYSVAEAKKNGMISHSFMNLETSHGSSFEGGSTNNRLAYPRSRPDPEMDQEEDDDRLPIKIIDDEVDESNPEDQV